MKPLPLLLVLALLAAPLRAQTAAPPAGRDALLAEISSWRQAQLVHVVPPDPLTAEFEPRLDEIQGRVKAAQSADELTPAGKDLKAWEHDLLTKKFAETKRDGLTRGSLNDFSRDQRDHVRGFALRTDAIAAARLKETSAQLFDGGGSDEAAVETGAGTRRVDAAAPGAAPAPGLHINPAPLPPPSAKPLSLDSLEEYFDRTGISEAVVRSVEKIKNEVAGYGHLLGGFAGSCYYGVKWMLIKTHVLPPEVEAPAEIGKIGIGSGNAYEMSAALKRNPQLQAKLHVRSLDLTTVTDGDARLIPERTMLVFDRGCAGFSEESGHIEYTLLPDKLKDLPASAFHRVGLRHGVYKPSVEANEVLACSDGCMVHTMAYLRTYGRQRCLNAYVPISEAPTQLASAESPTPGF
jgi:hypothetical protein